MRLQTRRLPRLALTLLLSAAAASSLSGCISLGGRPEPTTKVEYTWAKLGTTARVIEKKPIAVLVEVDGKQVPGTAVPAGMCLIDEPTLELYREAYEAQQTKE